MANERNLIPNSQRSPSEVRENGRKGGIESGIVRRENRDRKKAAQAVMDAIVKDPEILKKLKDAGINTDGITYEKAMDYGQVLKAAREGDTPAYRASKEEAYGKMDNKTELEVSGEVSGIAFVVKRLDKEEK